MAETGAGSRLRFHEQPMNVRSSIHRTALLAAMLLAAAACGSESTTKRVASANGAGAATDAAPPPAPEPAGGATAAPAAPVCASGGPTSFAGTYRVPVTDALAPYASFPVDSVDYCARDGAVELSYALPELLVGKSTKVSFRGSYDRQTGAYLLRGSDGDATCTASGDTWSCREQLVDLKIDASSLAQQLSALPPAEASARRNVASAFGQDPIGVLTFTAR